MRRVRVARPSRFLMPLAAAVCSLVIAGGVMVIKVDRSRSADTSASGLYPSAEARDASQACRGHSRRSCQAKAYPTPVRIVGGDYSQTRCVGGDGGTTVNSARSTRSWNSARATVRAQAGVRDRHARARTCGARPGAAADAGDGPYDLGRRGRDHPAAGFLRSRRRADSSSS